MSLLNGLNAAAKGLSDTLDLGIKSYLEQDKIRLADSLAGAREEKGDYRRQEIARTTAEEEVDRAGRRVRVVGEATEAQAAKDAPAARARKVADEKAILDFKTDPGNVTQVAQADALKASIVAKSAAATQAELLKDPEYVKNLKLMVSVEHPERGASAAASAAAAAASRYKLDVEKEIGVARKEMAAAATPEAREAAKTKINALEWSVAADRADQTARVGVMRVLKDEIAAKEVRVGAMTKDALGGELTPAQQATKVQLEKEIQNAQATLNAYVDQDAKTRGITVKAAEKPADRLENGRVFKNNVDIGPAASVEEARRMLKAPTPQPKADGVMNAGPKPTPSTPAPNTSGGNTSELFAQDIATGRALKAAQATTQQQLARLGPGDSDKRTELLAAFAQQAAVLQPLEAKLKDNGISL